MLPGIPAEGRRMGPLSDRIAPVASRLAHLRRVVRLLFALDGGARLVLAASAFVVVTFAIDWTFHLPAAARVVLLVAGLALFAWVFLRRLFRPLAVAVTDDDLGILVERRYPELNDRLISAIQLSRDPGIRPGAPGGDFNSPELVRALVEDAVRAAERVDFGSILVRRRVGWRVGGAALAAVFLAAGVMVSPLYASIYLSRIVGGARRWPRRTHLRVLDFVDGRRVIARGDDLTIAVECGGLEPSKVVLRYEFRSGERGTERMSPLPGRRYQYTFPRVPGPFEFTVAGGDDVTDRHFVETLNPPAIEAMAVFYEYPAYLRRSNTPPDRPESSGNVMAPFHTRVRFEALSTENLQSAELVLGGRGKERISGLKVDPAADGRPRRLMGTFEVSEAFGEYSLRLLGQNGLANRDPVRFTIRGLEDRLPEILVLEPPGDELVSDLCERPLEIETKDDYGIARIVLEYRVLAQQKEKGRDWMAEVFGDRQNSREYGETHIRSRHTLDIGSMGLQAGDHVELRFRAEDFKDVGPPHVRTTRVYKFSVVPAGALEKDLQDAIEKVKQVLRGQKIRQEAAWTRTAGLIDRHGKIDLLSQEQEGELRQTGLEQSDLTARLDTARRDLQQVMRRGVYNKIYNETAAAKLQGAVDVLTACVGEAGEFSRPGISLEAAARLNQAARIRGGAARTAVLREAQALQNAVATEIQKAIDFLDKWSSYQEVIRLTREILEMQKRVNEKIKAGP